MLENTSARVEHYAIFAITSKIVRITMEGIEMKNSLESKLLIDSIYSITILNILEVKTSFSKCSTFTSTQTPKREPSATTVY